MARRIKEGSRKTASNFWTSLLAFSCLAMLVSCGLLCLEWSRYPDQKPAPAKVASRR